MVPQPGCNCFYCNPGKALSYGLDLRGNGLFESLFGSPAGAKSPQSPSPSSYSVANDLRRIIANAGSGKEALDAVDTVNDALVDAEEAATARHAAEEALKSVAKLGRANAQARRFVVAYRPIKGGDVKTLEGVERTDGKVMITSATGQYPFTGTTESQAKLSTDALKSGFYMAVSYVDKAEA